MPARELKTYPTDGLPEVGEIWYSPLTAYKTKIKAVDHRQGYVIVTDGRQHYRMFLSDFRDPRNKWRRIT